MLTRRQLVLSGLAARFAAAAVSSPLQPWLQDVQPDRATLVWTSDPASPNALGSQPQWATWAVPGASPTITSITATPLPDGRFLYKTRLEGLPAATEVSYSLGPITGKLRMPESTPGQLRFLVFGDSGTGSEEQLQLARLMEAESAALVLHTGDIAYPLATDEGLENFYFKTYRGLMSRTSFYPCPGNHDYEDDLLPYRRWHALPHTPGIPAKDQGRYYNFDSQGVEFISLDSNDSLSEGTSMLSWLDTRLAQSRAFWRIAYFHHPPYTAGYHANNVSCRLAAERLAPRLEAAEIPLVINGHEHSYQRLASRQTTYVISGGGGGGLYPPGAHPNLIKSGTWHHYLRASIDTWRMRIEAIGLEGEILDQFELAPPPTLKSAVNSANFQPRLAPGGLLSLFGHHLCASPNDLSVDLDGESLQILGTSGTQLNLRLPNRSPGRATLRIKTPNGEATREIELLRSAPVLFRDPQSRPLTNNPHAREGDTVKLYLTGSANQRFRLRLGTRILGEFQATPVPTVPGVEKITVTLPTGWHQLELDPLPAS